MSVELAPMVELSAGELMVTVGGVTSMTKSTCGGLSSSTLAGEVERANSVCAPSVSAGVVNGEVQTAKLPLWILHSIVEPAIEVVRSNVGVVSLIGPVGTNSGLIVVTGATAIAPSGVPPAASGCPPASGRLPASAPVGASLVRASMVPPPSGLLLPFNTQMLVLRSHV